MSNTFLDVDQAASLLGISRRHFARLATKLRLSPLIVGPRHKRFYLREDVERASESTLPRKAVNT